MEMALAVGIVFCLLGVVVLVKLVQRKRWAARAALWPSVPGVIVESRVDFAQPGSGHDDTLAFLYRYEVAGELFGRRRVGLFDGAAIGTERMQAIARDYPAGREVAVFHDPARPGDSVLEPTSRRASRKACGWPGC